MKNFNKSNMATINGLVGASKTLVKDYKEYQTTVLSSRNKFIKKHPVVSAIGFGAGFLVGAYLANPEFFDDKIEKAYNLLKGEFKKVDTSDIDDNIHYSCDKIYNNKPVFDILCNLDKYNYKEIYNALLICNLNEFETCIDGLDCLTLKEVYFMLCVLIEYQNKLYYCTPNEKLNSYEKFIITQNCHLVQKRIILKEQARKLGIDLIDDKD